MWRRAGAFKGGADPALCVVAPRSRAGEPGQTSCYAPEPDGRTLMPETDVTTTPLRHEPAGMRIFLATFAILALELALIRWTSGQVRLFAYFSNLVLITAFMGLGLGLALGRRHAWLLHMALPALAVLSVPLAFSEPLGLVHLTFPDTAVHIWGAEAAVNGLTLARNLAIFLALLLLVVVVFVAAGAGVGSVFGRLEPLRAYRADLAGSLLGVLAITAVTALGPPPVAWLALAVLPLGWLSRRPLAVLCGVAVLALAGYSARGAVYSPYNRIDLLPRGTGWVLQVNRDFHQTMTDLSDHALAAASVQPEGSTRLAVLRDAYELPFTVSRRRGSALVVGAGAGNDVAAALRLGYARVVPVEIDARIFALGTRLHPERPYADPRVTPVVDDARAYFEQHRGQTFDVVAYGLLDSHSMFTALSTLRLDNYVYTEEGIRAAWRMVAPEGHLALSFSVFAGDWIANRLYWTIAAATGRPPVAFHHDMNHGCTFIVPGPRAQLDLRGVPFPPFAPGEPAELTRTTSDDWPFLYVRPGIFPWGYLAVLVVVLVAAVAGTRLAYGRTVLGTGFDPVLFAMGAAFLLIETRGVTALSLLFGSTWVVNAAVFAGILLMALLANEAVARLRPRRVEPWLAALMLSVVLVWLIPQAALNHLPLLLRGLAGGVLNGLPIGFAGVVFSLLLARSADAAAALGSNLLGAVLGGALEYLSMLVGLRALALLALVLYLAAWVLARRGVLSAPTRARAC